MDNITSTTVANSECCFKAEGPNKIPDIMEADILLMTQQL